MHVARNLAPNTARIDIEKSNLCQSALDGGEVHPRMNDVRCLTGPSRGFQQT